MSQIFICINTLFPRIDRKSALLAHGHACITIVESIRLKESHKAERSWRVGEGTLHY